MIFISNEIKELHFLKEEKCLKFETKPLTWEDVCDRDTYKRVVKGYKGNHKYKLWISPLLLEVISELSPTGVKVLFLIAKQVGWHNVAYVHLPEFYEHCSRPSVYRALKELRDMGLLREMSNNLPKGDRLYKVSPVYFYLGWYPYRDVLVKNWIKEVVV